MTTPGTGRPGASPHEAHPARGWWVAFVLLAALLAMLWGVMAQRPAAEYAPGVTPTPTPTPTPTIPDIARQQVWTSDTPASGVYLGNTLALAPLLDAPDIITYRLQVEDTTHVDADTAAGEVHATLGDQRGWAGYGKRTFQLVPADQDADLTIYIASPETTDALCAPLDVESKWNCRVDDRVVLNSDRWLYMTPTYDDLGTYRSYLVNHEVGHYLGLAHVGCPASGAAAPVMMQQSIDLGGCTPNAWPREAD